MYISYICVYVCVHIYNQSNRVRPPDKNTTSALFFPSFHRLGNQSFLIWWASLNQVSNYHIPRAVW